VLVEHGFTCATLPDGTEYSFTPSLGRVAALGSPREIVELYADLHGQHAARRAAEVLAAFCDQEDATALIGWLDLPAGGAPSWHPGAMPEAEQVIIARHLMQHAIAGKARPGTATEKRGEYATEFHVAEHIAAARVHLGLSAEEALACSMSELQQLIETKFPDPKASKGKSLPTREQYEAGMARMRAANAARAAKKGAEAPHG
jgi:hypothetical protein